MKQKIKTTAFWLALSSAIVVILDTISGIIGVELYSKEVKTIIMSICSILIILGIVTKKSDEDKDNSTTDELLSDIKDKNDLD